MMNLAKPAMACLTAFLLSMSLAFNVVAQSDIDQDVDALLNEIGSEMSRQPPELQAHYVRILRSIYELMKTQSGAGRGSSAYSAPTMPNDSPEQTEPARGEVTEPALHYSFETDAGTEGWEIHEHVDYKACTQIFVSDEIARNGSRSLRLELDLDPSEKEKEIGEIWAYIAETSGTGERKYLDLDGRNVKTYLFCPGGASGDRHAPNGAQIFVVDAQGRKRYGPWANLVDGKWNELSHEIGSSQTDDIWMQPGFDPHAIERLGVKVACPQETPVSYLGPVYLDAVEW